MLKITFLSSIFLFISSCSGLLPHRTFVREMSYSGGFLQAGRDFPVVSGDSGFHYWDHDDIYKQVPMSLTESRQQKEYYLLKEELNRRERRLSSSEYKDYIQLKPYLNTNSEKIYYLSLASQERRLYSMAKRKGEAISIPKHQTSPYNQPKRQLSSLPTSRLSYKNIISRGMDKDTVLKRFGSPQRVEVAGDPHKQYERWSFYQDGKLRQIYFGSGVVENWR